MPEPKKDVNEIIAHCDRRAESLYQMLAAEGWTVWEVTAILSLAAVGTCRVNKTNPVEALTCVASILNRQDVVEFVEGGGK